MKNILVIGSTGAMGSAVIHSLLNSNQSDSQIYAFTRDVKSAAAVALKALDTDRVILVTGDLDDPVSLKNAMRNMDVVFCNTAFFSTGSVAGERRQGLAALKAAKEAGVEHFIYSSLDPVARLSGGALPVPHYDGKAIVEAEIDAQRSDEFMSQVKDGWYCNHATVLVMCPYIENFYDFFAPIDGTLSDGRQGKIFKGPISGNGRWQMIALDDLGAFTRIVIEDRKTWGGKTLRVASEELTMTQIVSTFEEITGIPAEYRPMSENEFLSSGLPSAHDPLNNMLMYREGFYAERDYDLLKSIHPTLMTFKQWLIDSKWRGESRTMRKNAPTGGE